MTLQDSIKTRHVRCAWRTSGTTKINNTQQLPWFAVVVIGLNNNKRLLVNLLYILVPQYTTSFGTITNASIDVFALGWDILLCRCEHRHWGEESKFAALPRERTSDSTTHVLDNLSASTQKGTWFKIATLLNWNRTRGYTSKGFIFKANGLRECK